MALTLVTGAGGFVGKALCAAMVRSGRQIRKATRKSGDLSDPAVCRRLLKNTDTVYYLAGHKKNLKFHLADPFDFVAGNVQPLLTFLASMKHSRVRRFVYLSTTLVEYQGSGPALDGYVLGKYLNEQILEAYRRGSKARITIARSTAIYGPGDNFDPATANFIPATIRKVARARHELPVWGKGTRKVQFIYIDDLVRNLLAAERAGREFYAFGHPESRSVNEVVRQVIKISGKKLAIQNTGGADKPTKLIKFHNAAAPQVSLARGLAMTWQYFTGHG